MSQPLNNITPNNLQQFQKDIQANIKAIETKLISRIEQIPHKIDNKLFPYEIKFQEIQNKVEEYFNTIFQDKAQSEKINQLLIFKKLTENTLTTHINMIQQCNRELTNVCNKYDKIIQNNIFIPGLFGNDCKYPSFKDFAEQLIEQFEIMNKFKDNQIIEINNIKDKVNIILKEFSTKNEKKLKLLNEIKNKAPSSQYDLSSLENQRNSLLPKSKTEIEKNEILQIKEEIIEQFTHEKLNCEHKYNEILNKLEIYKKNFQLLNKKFEEISEFVYHNQIFSKNEKRYNSHGKLQELIADNLLNLKNHKFNLNITGLIQNDCISPTISFAKRHSNININEDKGQYKTTQAKKKTVRMIKQDLHMINNCDSNNKCISLPRNFSNEKLNYSDSQDDCIINVITSKKGKSQINTYKFPEELRKDKHKQQRGHNNISENKYKQFQNSCYPNENSPNKLNYAGSYFKNNSRSHEEKLQTNIFLNPSFKEGNKSLNISLKNISNHENVRLNLKQKVRTSQTPDMNIYLKETKTHSTNNEELIQTDKSIIQRKNHKHKLNIKHFRNFTNEYILKETSYNTFINNASNIMDKEIVPQNSRHNSNNLKEMNNNSPKSSLSKTNTIIFSTHNNNKSSHKSQSNKKFLHKESKKISLTNPLLSSHSLIYQSTQVSTTNNINETAKKVEPVIIKEYNKNQVSHL